MKSLFLSLLMLLIMSGCSSKPVLQTEGANQVLSAKQVADGGDSLRGTRVVWGGVIVHSSNLKNRSQLEVLAYPINSELRPQADQPAVGRFLAYRKDYLETVDYAPGRQVSMVGTISGIKEALLGEQRYQYPTIDIEQLHLWPVASTESEPRVRFGIGVIFHN